MNKYEFGPVKESAAQKYQDDPHFRVLVEKWPKWPEGTGPNTWIETRYYLPVSSHTVFYLAHLTDEHMWVTHRTHPYDVVSGWYINAFQKLYTHWRMIPEIKEKESG